MPGVHVSIHLLCYHRAPGNAGSRSLDLGGLSEDLLASAGSTAGVHVLEWSQRGWLGGFMLPRSVVFDGSACFVLCRTSFTKRNISLSQQRSREKRFPKSLVRLPVGWRRRVMQLQLRYCCVYSGCQVLSLTRKWPHRLIEDRFTSILCNLFFANSCFPCALSIEKNTKFLQPYVHLEQLQQ